jgi:hypothetical protein
MFPPVSGFRTTTNQGGEIPAARQEKALVSSLKISISGPEPFYKPFFHEVIHVFLRGRG